MRYVHKPITLSNGVVLQPGTQLLMPAGLISLDSDIWESAEEFRGFRFHELRQARKDDAFKYQFATTGPRTMHFGHGKQSCPGRFFASHEIKAILAHVLTEYDIKLVDETKGRPKNREFGAQIAPDETAKVAFRKRPD
jgi:ent-kaurene oxidase